MDRWSDGKICVDLDVDWYLDPAVRCSNCQQLFITAASQKPNTWGFNIPKDIKFHGAKPLDLEDCQLIMSDKAMLTTIGSFNSFYWFMDSGINYTNEAANLLAGEISMRLAIWSKLNDRVRYQNHVFTPDERELFRANARALLKLIPKNANAELFLLKAELHRNMGQFLNSLLILSKIDSTASRFTKKRIIRLNLLMRRKLAKLNRVPFRRTPFGQKVQQLKYRVEDFFDSFRRK